MVVTPRLRMNFEKGRKTGKVCGIESSAGRISWNVGCSVVLGRVRRGWIKRVWLDAVVCMAGGRAVLGMRKCPSVHLAKIFSAPDSPPTRAHSTRLTLTLFFPPRWLLNSTFINSGPMVPSSLYSLGACLGRSLFSSRYTPIHRGARRLYHSLPSRTEALALCRGYSCTYPTSGIRPSVAAGFPAKSISPRQKGKLAQISDTRSGMSMWDCAPITSRSRDVGCDEETGRRSEAQRRRTS